MKKTITEKQERQFKRMFKEVDSKFKKHPDVETVEPYRSTKGSAGYDFESKENVIIQPKSAHTFTTDVKAYMGENEFLAIYPRGGFGYGGQHLSLTNTVGIIDSDFADSESSGGNINIRLYNNASVPKSFAIGDRIAQGIFQEYLTVDNDGADGVRTGGFHSTGK